MDLSRGRLTVRVILADALGHLIDFDRPFWRTIREFLVRPGEVARGYVAGQRRTYASPFKVFVVGATLATLIQIALMELTSTPDPSLAVPSGSTREQAIRVQINQFLTQNSHLMNIALVPVLALAYVPLFRRTSGYNLAEQCVGVFYTYGIMFFASSAIAPWQVLLPNLSIQVLGFLVLTSYAIVVAVLFNRDRWLPGIVKGILGHMALYAAVIGTSFLFVILVPKIIVAMG